MIENTQEVCSQRSGDSAGEPGFASDKVRRTAHGARCRCLSVRAYVGNVELMLTGTRTKQRASRSNPFLPREGGPFGGDKTLRLISLFNSPRKANSCSMAP